MRELINHLSDPVYSFSIVIALFIFIYRYPKIFGSKKFALVSLILLLPIFVWFCLDHNFFSIISIPDNLPILILIGTVLFFTWFSMYKGNINDERIERGEPPIEGTPEMREKVWCWPNLVYTELFVIICGTIFLIVWGILFKAPLEEPANPTWAPNPAKAPWYFLGLQEMLVYFDPWMAGVVLPGLIVVGLIAIPFIDINPKGNGYYTFKERRFAITAFSMGWLVLWVFLIIIGTFLRGPNWTFYGPFEYWDVHKVVAQNNINLSEIFWIKMLRTSMPSNIIFREFLGILATILYFAIPIPLLEKFGGKDIRLKMGNIRYYLTIFLVLGMMSLPLKMYLRWFLNLKYIVAMPEFELNL